MYILNIFAVFAKCSEALIMLNNKKRYKTLWLCSLFLLLLVQCKNRQGGDAGGSLEDSLAAKYGKGSEAIVQLDKEIEKEPENAELYYRRANQWAKEQNPAKALKDIQHAVSLSPQNALYRFSLGEIAFMNDSVTLAYNSFTEATKLKPDFTDAFIKLGELQMILHQHKESNETFDRVAELDASNATAFYFKGRNYAELKDTTQAIASYKKAVALNNDYYDAFIQLGNLYYQMGGGANLKLAEEYFTNAIRIKELSAEAIYARALVYYDAAMFDKAVRDYEKVIAIDPDDYRPYSGVGLINFNLDRYEDALTYFDKALTMNPEYVRGYYYRGLTLMAKGDNPKAIQDFKTVLKLDPEFNPAKEMLKQLGVKNI